MNSKQFIIDRMNRGLFSIGSMTTNDVENAVLIKPFETWSFDGMDKVLHGNVMQYLLAGENQDGRSGNSVVTITYDEEGDFDYITSDIRVHNGDLMSLAEALNDMRVRIMSVETFKVPPTEFTSIWDYNIRYTIGDFVIVNQSGVDEQTQIVCLPIKCEFVRKTIQN